jgi:hypothetical protein
MEGPLQIDRRTIQKRKKTIRVVRQKNRQIWILGLSERRKKTIRVVRLRKRWESLMISQRRMAEGEYSE